MVIPAHHEIPIFIHSKCMVSIATPRATDIRRTAWPDVNGVCTTMLGQRQFPNDSVVRYRSETGTVRIAILPVIWQRLRRFISCLSTHIWRRLCPILTMYNWEGITILLWSCGSFIHHGSISLKPLLKGLRPVLEGFVVPMHEGACETGSQIPRALARGIWRTVRTSPRNCRLTIPVVKGRCAREALHHAFNIFITVSFVMKGIE